MSTEADCGCGGTVAAAKYPWDKCIRDQRKRGHSKESASKICGYIKKKYGKAEAAPADAYLEAERELSLTPSPALASITCAQGLCLDAGAEDAPAVWNVVAYEGEFKGHQMGAFAFTRDTFEQIVRNFREDPRYTRRTADGLPPITEATPEQIAGGGYDVLQWDFHHASEMPAPTVATAGAPSQGWVLEAKLTEYQGKAALAVLTRWLEPARGYIKAERYKFCSVSVWLDASDPVSGEPIGAVLTSIAITNNPFLQGLPPLRASRDGTVTAGMWYGPASNNDHAFGNIRNLFCLPETADVAAVVAKLAEVRAWVGGGPMPAGFPPDATAKDVVCGLRQILALPLLTGDTDVFSQTETLLSRVSQPTELPAAVAAPSQEIPMTTNATGAANSAKDATALPAAGTLLVAGPDLRNALAKLEAKKRNCSVDDITDGHILMAAEGAAGLQAKIDEIMSTLGAKTLAEALAKITAAEELKTKLQEALTGKAAAEEAMQGYEEDMAEEDMGMALASLGVTDVTTQAGKLICTALRNERGKTAESILAFRKQYNIDALRKDARTKLSQAAQQIIAERSADNAAPQHLTASIATTRQTPPATPPRRDDTPQFAIVGNRLMRVSAAPVSQEASPGVNAARVTLSQIQQQYPGEPNDHARAVAFVKAEHARNNPGAKALDHEDACMQASNLMRTLRRAA